MDVPQIARFLKILGHLEFGLVANFGDCIGLSTVVSTISFTNANANFIYFIFFQFGVHPNTPRIPSFENQTL